MITVKLGDILTLKRGYDLPASSRGNGSVPIVSSSGIMDYHNQSKVSGPGVVTGRYGTIGEVYFVPEDYWPLNTALYVQDFKGHDPRFIYYYLSYVLRGIQSDKAAVPGVNRNDLHSRIVRCPPKALHTRIADILSAYDDLIENNRRRIHLLEEAARLLYREWFVHLRFPGHERARVVDGVPEGWERRTIDDVGDTVGGGTPSTSVPEYWDGGEITWFVPKDLTNNESVVLLGSERKITQAGLQNSSAKLLPPNTILMTSRASLGYFGLYDGEAATNQGFISILPYDDKYRMYLLFNFMYRASEIESHAGGTTFKEINKSTFRKLPVVLPSENLAKEFEAKTGLLVMQIRNLKKQIEGLKKARDLLLPRLMNGEVEV